MNRGRRARLAAILSIAVAGPAAADTVAFRATAVPFNLADPGRESVAGLHFRGGVVLTSTDAEFGGFSDMIACEDGSLLVVSDIGLWWRILPRHDAAGRLAGITRLVKNRMADDEGRPFAGKESSDAEALALLDDGTLLVAFEHRHRLRRYAPDDEIPAGPARAVAAPAGMALLEPNSGVEAIARLEPGQLLLLAEGADGDAGDISGWLGRPGDWAPLTIARRGSFRPTALAGLAGGDLLLLERSYSLATGVGIRLSRIAKDTVAAGARIEPDTIIELRPPYAIDNFEALAAVPAADGGTDIFLLSDDNQNPLQRTILLQLHSPER